MSSSTDTPTGGAPTAGAEPPRVTWTVVSDARETLEKMTSREFPLFVQGWSTAAGVLRKDSWPDVREEQAGPDRDALAQAPVPIIMGAAGQVLAHFHPQCEPDGPFAAHVLLALGDCKRPVSGELLAAAGRFVSGPCWNTRRTAVELMRRQGKAHSEHAASASEFVNSAFADGDARVLQPAIEAALELGVEPLTVAGLIEFVHGRAFHGNLGGEDRRDNNGDMRVICVNALLRLYQQNPADSPDRAALKAKARAVASLGLTCPNDNVARACRQVIEALRG
jgi:hypothetical protein